MHSKNFLRPYTHSPYSFDICFAASLGFTLLVFIQFVVGVGRLGISLNFSYLPFDFTHNQIKNPGFFSPLFCAVVFSLHEQTWNECHFFHSLIIITIKKFYAQRFYFVNFYASIPLCCYRSIRLSFSRFFFLSFQRSRRRRHHSAFLSSLRAL